MDDRSVKSRLTVDADQLNGDVEEALAAAGRLLQDDEFCTLLGEDNAQALQARYSAVSRQREEPFTLVVVGDFKRGKSMLINALLGMEVVPTAVTPETVTINRLQWGETPRMQAILTNGYRITLHEGELRHDELTAISAHLPADIDHVLVESPAPLLREITLVDTPGMGDMLQAYEARVAEYLVHADAVLYVMNARMPLSMTEQTFLKTILLPQQPSRIQVIMNMADTLETEEDIRRVCEYTRDKLVALDLPGSVYPISALDEFCRATGKKRPAPALEALLARGFDALRDALQTDILVVKDVLKATRSLTVSRQLLADMHQRTDLIQQAVALDVHDAESAHSARQAQADALRADVDGRKQDILARVEAMHREAQGWMDGFLGRLHTELSQLAAGTDMRDLERYFQFFLMDSIAQAVDACVKAHGQALSEALNESLRAMVSLAQDMPANGLREIQGNIAGHIDYMNWTGVDSAFHFATTVMDAVGLSSLKGFGYMLAGIARQGKARAQQAQYVQPVLDGWADIARGVHGELDSAYAQLGLTAQEALERCFQDELEMAGQALAQAQRLTRDERGRGEEIGQRLRAYGERIDRIGVPLLRYDTARLS